MNRRVFLGAALGIPAALTLPALTGACSRTRGDRAFDASTPQQHTPPTKRAEAPPVASSVPVARPHTAQCIITEPNIEGPFFKAGAPWRADFVTTGTVGDRFTVAGRVLDTRCKPIPGTKLEFWQANHRGEYDNKGTRFRGTLAADPSGRFHLDTIVPGRYLNGDTYRPAHIHVKLSAPGFAPLTTQLYFPDDPYNKNDPWIRESLIMKVRHHKDRGLGDFDFVLA